MTEILVKSLWRYPVKSMQGEECSSLTIEHRGIQGDRLFAIRNLQGKFGSGKNTRRFRHIDGLLMFRAFYQEDVPVIEFPNGNVVGGDEPHIHDELSQILNQTVTLAKENKISHFDDSPIHLVSSAALQWLKTALPDSQINLNRFRANLLLDVAGNTPVEHQWIGKQIQIGNQVRLKITKLAERCIMTSSRQLNLPEDPQIFDYIINESQMMFGVYAQVANSGTVNIGERVNFID